MDGKAEARARREERELSRRIREADRECRRRPEARKELARQAGIDTHTYLEARIRLSEAVRGRREGRRTFEIERTVRDGKGRRHRIDVWDHEKQRVMDIKPVKPGTTVGELLEKHGKQLQRYVKAIESTTGEKVREVAIRPYPAVDAPKEGGRR